MNVSSDIYVLNQNVRGVARLAARLIAEHYAPDMITNPVLRYLNRHMYATYVKEGESAGPTEHITQQSTQMQSQQGVTPKHTWVFGLAEMICNKWMI